jgi:Asp-tRNA(Asn)/Glu-tRNA(Gln) amidotransferase B subunit
MLKLIFSFFGQIQIQILYWFEIQQRIVISNNTINRHTQNMKQLKTKSSMRAEEAKSHYNELITNTI